AREAYRRERGGGGRSVDPQDQRTRYSAQTRDAHGLRDAGGGIRGRHGDGVQPDRQRDARYGPSDAADRRPVRCSRAGNPRHGGRTAAPRYGSREGDRGGGGGGSNGVDRQDQRTGYSAQTRDAHGLRYA